MKLSYGQWECEFEIKNFGNSWVTGKPLNECVVVQICGNWCCDTAIYYNNGGQEIGYNNPELLPKGLKSRILKKCKSILRKTS